MTLEKDDFANFFTVLAMRCLIIELILHEILESHPFLMSQNFKTQGRQWHGVKHIKAIFVGKGIEEKGFGALLYFPK